MKVTVDKDLCAGTGLCQNTCPEVFEVDEEGVSTVKKNPVPREFEQACKEAAEHCPTNAISVEQ
jgi:ferredoxin